jgi:hypothetical protein
VIETSTIRVLHDFDNPYLSGRYALRRGLKLIIYALSRKVPLFRRWVREIYAETHDNCKTLAAIDKLVGVKSNFGLKDEVVKAFPQLSAELREMGFPVHRHMHYSRTAVSWDPSLDVEPQSWFFDQRYASTGEIPPDTKWAVFHADYPQLMPAYVSFLGKAIGSGRLGLRQP